MRIGLVVLLAPLAIPLACQGEDPALGDGPTGADATTEPTSEGSADTTASAPTEPATSADASTSGASADASDSSDTGEPDQPVVDLFRVSTVGLLAPNFYLPGCGLANDSLPIFIDPALVADDDGDGLYDLSIVAGIELDDPAGILRFGEGECTTTPEQCTLPTPDFDSPFTSMAQGACYEADASLFVTDSDLGPSAVLAPCVAASGEALTIDLGAFSLPLVHAEVATTTEADPVDTEVTHGIVQGFLTKAVADTTFLPKNETFDALMISGEPLSDFLPRPFFECESTQAYGMSPTGELGWYVLLTFSAPAVDSTPQ